MTSDLIAYLCARLDEEGAVAHEANTDEARRPWGDHQLAPVAAEKWGDLVDGYLGGPVGQHCATWSPLRVLADIAAKRALLKNHSEHEGWCPGCERNCKCDLIGDCTCDIWAEWPCPLAVALVQPYADRPDFDPTWRTGAAS